MTEGYTDTEFELRLPALIRGYGEQALRPFDATEIARTATGRTAAPRPGIARLIIEIGAARLRRRTAGPWAFPPDSELALWWAVGATIIAVGLGALLFGARTDRPTAGVPSPALSASPRPAESAQPLRDGVLPAGRYAWQPLSFLDPDLTVAVDVPAGWQGIWPPAIVGPRGGGSLDGMGITVLGVSGLYSDGCHRAKGGTLGDIVVGPTADGLAAALAAHPRYRTTVPSPAVVDGYPALQMDAALPADVDPASCDEGRYLVFGTPDLAAWPPDGDLPAQGPGGVDHLTIVDVNGTRVVIVVHDYAATPAGDRAEAKRVIDSVAFSRPGQTPAIPDGRYQSEVMQSADIVRLVAASGLGDGTEASLLDNTFGVRNTTTLQVVLEVRGQVLVPGLRHDGGPAQVQPEGPWRVSTIGPGLIEAKGTPFGELQRFEVDWGDGAFRLAPVIGAEDELAALIRRILYLSSPFTPVP